MKGLTEKKKILLSKFTKNKVGGEYKFTMKSKGQMGTVTVLAVTIREMTVSFLVYFESSCDLTIVGVKKI